jgi:hypothetical protein
MAGVYNNVYLDSCYEEFQDEKNDGIYDYVLNRDAVMRPNTVEAPLLSAGYQPDFYGPLVGNRVTRESFLQGRGHCVNKCPDCGVVYLPESLFPAHGTASKCDRVDMQPLYTRLPKSCNGLSETIVTPYHQMPSNYKKGYQGMSAVVDTHIQSRVGPPQHQRSYDPCATNYGSYKRNPRFEKYQ